MKKLLLFSALIFLVAGCSTHQHTVMEKHWHSCDGETFYTPIEYDEQLKSCADLIKDDILLELKND